ARLVGLEFRPRGLPAVADIRGTLWLQREPAELRSIEYRYEGLPFRMPRELSGESIGGTARYMRLESGMWILSGWTLSAPRPHTNAAGTPGTRQVLLMSEHNARVMRALDGAGQLLYSAGMPTGRASAANRSGAAVGRAADRSVAGHVDAARQAARPEDITFPGGSMPARLWVAQRCGGTPQEGRMHIVGVA